jgi:hypothetical protein
LYFFQEAEINRITVRGQTVQKVRKIPSQQISWTWWKMPVISSTQEIEVEGSQSETGPCKNMRPYPKLNGSKKGRGLGSSGKYLPSKHKALSSNSSTAKKKKKLYFV